MDSSIRRQSDIGVLRSRVTDTELLNAKLSGLALRELGEKYEVSYQRVNQRLNTIDDEVTVMQVKGLSKDEISVKLGINPEYIGKYFKYLNKKYT